MTFPHVLRTKLGDEKPQKLHSLAYNFGIRPEEADKAHGSLCQLISEDDIGLYSDRYFSTPAQVGDFIDPRIYRQRCQDYYQEYNSSAIAFGAVAAGIAALGSFLSPNRHPRESELVQYAKCILDDPASVRVLQADHIIAWAMRIFYLRATSRPSSAWIASCTAMHLCEVVGLNNEIVIKEMAFTAGATALGHDTDRLRRIFWIIWAGHNMLSYECDRSSVQFRTISTRSIIPSCGSVAYQFIRIAQIIPSQNSPLRLEYQSSIPREDIVARFGVLERFKVTDPFLVVTKADLAFFFYRRLYQLKMGIPEQINQFLIDVGGSALTAATQLASRGLLFWNVIGSLFQYICVLLAIDASEASAYIPAAFAGLEGLVETVDTKFTREALSMARRLLSLTVTRKRKELAQLEPAQESNRAFQAQSEANANEDAPEPEITVDWDQFLFEPFFSMLSRDF